MSIRIGIDVGGTFTDGVVVDEKTGDVGTIKLFTNSADPAGPVLEMIDALPGSLSSTSEATRKVVSGIFHGTTLASNALVERKTPTVGLLCTAGFRDVLDTRRTRRKYLYDVMWDKPQTLVRRMYRREVSERLNHRGEVIAPLDEESVREAVAFLARNGVADFAVAFLYSYLDAVHERRARDIILEMVPDAEVSLSSEVIPEHREFERTTTTVLNAMIRRLIDRYLERLEKGILERGISGPLQIMKANGGVARAATVRKRPIETYESGPAGGVTAAVAIGDAIGTKNVITFDVGGTTSDVSMIWNGNPIMSLEEEMEWSIPIRIPMIHIRSVGSGGGSIAWIDKGGALKVGPQSAGSEPGPACYGRGGVLPTLTDANLVLGWMGPRLLGGEVTLDKAASERAIQENVAHFLDWDTVKVAYAVNRIASMDMVHLIREVSVNKGYDPRDFSLMCFGGAGGLHAVEVAKELEISEVIIPANAGVFSAVGCLFADVRHEYVQTFTFDAKRAPLDQLNDVFTRMRTGTIENLQLDRLESKSVIFQHLLHLRYHGEAYTISVPLNYTFLGANWTRAGADEAAFQIAVPIDADASGQVSQAAIDEAVAAFHAEHERLYGFAREDPVENVDLGLNARVELSHPKILCDRTQRDPAKALVETRPAYFVERFHDTPVFDRYALGCGAAIKGPAIVQEKEATTVVPPGSEARIDEYRNLRIQVS